MAIDIDKVKGYIPSDVFDELKSNYQKLGITNNLRLAHFLSQCAHESGNFNTAKENLNYSASGLKRIFGKYFPGNTADSYQKQPQKIGSRVYANRMGNGDESSSDGYNYRGRGYIQLTGKSNYKSFAKYIGKDVLSNPDIVATDYPLSSAAFFFSSTNLWKTCDEGNDETTIKKVTKKINGGYNGLDDRIKKFEKFWKILNGDTSGIQTVTEDETRRERRKREREEKRTSEETEVLGEGVDLVPGSDGNSITAPIEDVNDGTSIDDLEYLSPEEFLASQEKFRLENEPSGGSSTLVEDPVWGTYSTDGTMPDTLDETLDYSDIIEEAPAPNWLDYTGDVSKQLIEYKSPIKNDKGRIKKIKIILHHTNGWGDPVLTADAFRDAYSNGSPMRICTSWIIGGNHLSKNSFDSKNDGLIVRVYDDDKYYSNHSDFGEDHSITIGISLCNLGGLRQVTPTEYTNSLGATFIDDGSSVVEYTNGFRGFTYFHKISDKQLLSLKSLIIYLAGYYSIPVQKFYIYTEEEMQKLFDDDPEAKDLKIPGVFTHAQLNKTVHDLAPLSEVFAMLQSLTETEPEVDPGDSEGEGTMVEESTDVENIQMPKDGGYITSSWTSGNEKHLQKLNPDFREKLMELILFANKSGYELRITSSHRNHADVLRIYGKEKWSHHNFGLAIDCNLRNVKTKKVYLKKDSEATWLETGVPQYGEKLGFKWGGRKGFTDYHDPVHFDYQTKYPISTMKAKGKKKYGDDTAAIMDNGYKIV